MPPPNIGEIAEKIAIHALIVEAWASLDRKDWDGYAGAFASDGEFEILGQRRRGRAAIAAGPAHDLAKYDALQHIVTNVVANVAGETASGQWYVIAVHVLDASRPDQHSDVGLRYRFSAQRANGDWRLSEVVLELLWASGLPLNFD
jgi:uncharacterized protein (TIGR02246 family)